MIPSHKFDELRDWVEDSTSSSVTVRSCRSEDQIFDPGDHLNDDESRCTEPTSIGSEEGSNSTQEAKSKLSGLGSIEEDTLLLSDLDIHDRSIESSLKGVGKNEYLEDRNEGLDLDAVDVLPRNLVTTALNDFEPVEATLGQPSTPVAGTSAPALRCGTEESAIGSVDEIHLGLHDKIWRWKWNSQLKFNVNPQSFPSLPGMISAQKALELAAKEWNKGNLGVRFVPVAYSQDAVFQLTYSRDDGDEDILAESFIPRRPDRLERPQKLFVYPLLFKEQHSRNMANVFYHELGHILGLRHEFAPLIETNIRSVQWGPSNPHSVMNYYHDWSLCRIHPHDYASVRELYSFKGTEYRGFKIHDLDPDRFGRERSPPRRYSLKRTW